MTFRLSPWVIAIWCAAMAAATPSRAGETLVLRADNWFPYNGDPADEHPGYVVEMTRAILAKTGGTLDYRIMPWKRAVAEAEKGAINGVIGALKSDTPGFVFPEEPIGLSGSVVYVRKGSTWRYADTDSFKTIRLGVVDGYSYGEKVDAYVESQRGNAKTLDVSVGDTPEEVAIKKLLAARIDAYISDPAVFQARLTAMGLKPEEFVSVGVVAEPSPAYISLSPARPESAALAKQLTEGIRALRASGELAKILDRYGLKDWAPPRP